MTAVHAADVITILKAQYPWVISSQAPTFFDPANDASKVAELVALLEQIPSSLRPASRDDGLTFTRVLASLRQLLDKSRQGGSIYWPTVGNNNVLTTLWLLLQKCPDEAISETTGGLEFIADQRLRESIRLDMATAESTLAHGEWKASTVFSAVAMEALLLSAIVDLMPEAKNWHLPKYIEEARALGKIGEEAAQQARLAKDYRNLIHPGKEMREKQSCDRGTAHGAFSALQFIVRDLALTKR